MKYSEKAFLSIAFVLSVAFIMTTNGPISRHKTIEKIPANTGMPLWPQKLDFTHDTIYISRENFNKIKKRYTLGSFNNYKNRIKINHYLAQDSTTEIQNFCKYICTRRITVMRHEMEHARKAALVNKPVYTGTTRARVEVFNEIVSCTAEIIAALDYEFDTGKKYPGLDNLTRLARNEILAEIKATNLEWPIDFNNQKIADITIRHAGEYFLKHSHLYRKAISEKLANRQILYIPCEHCETAQYSLFNPDLNIWEPLWQFESRRGTVNPWIHSSNLTKTNLITKIDSLVIKIAGQNKHFYKNIKTR